MNPSMTTTLKPMIGNVCRKEILAPKYPIVLCHGLFGFAVLGKEPLTKVIQNFLFYSCDIGKGFRMNYKKMVAKYFVLLLEV
jgi:hypothetical protein